MIHFNRRRRDHIRDRDSACRDIRTAQFAKYRAATLAWRDQTVRDELADGIPGRCPEPRTTEIASL